MTEFSEVRWGKGGGMNVVLRTGVGIGEENRVGVK